MTNNDNNEGVNEVSREPKKGGIRVCAQDMHQQPNSPSLMTGSQSALVDDGG